MAPCVSTPKGLASGSTKYDYGVTAHCQITGEPQHDVFALQRLVSVHTCDRFDLLNDHKDMIGRLSSDPASTLVKVVQTQGRAEEAPVLPCDAENLLKTAISAPVDIFKRTLVQKPQQAIHLTNFLKHPLVRLSSTWIKIFSAYPPRGTLSRLAKRAGCKVNTCNERTQWNSLEDFKAEVAILKTWYATQKKKSLIRKGVMSVEKMGVY